MRRTKLAALGLGLCLGLMIGATSAVGSDQRGHRDGFVRWDLLLIADGVAVGGGVNVSTDQATGDTLELTGTGQAEPGEREAAGGGTFIQRHANGTEVTHGVYYVKRFLSWRRLAGGDFGATGLIDGVGNPGEREPTSGVLRLRIQFVPDVGGAPGPGPTGVLKINCHLPGTFVSVEEGFNVDVNGLEFDPDPVRHGVTLFHRLR
jgi:hypothetical protein